MDIGIISGEGGGMKLRSGWICRTDKWSWGHVVIVVGEGYLFFVVGKDFRRYCVFFKVRSDTCFVGGIDSVSKADIDHWSID